MTSVLINDLGNASMRGIDVGGFVTPDFMKPPEETKQIFEKVPEYKFKDGDLMLCTYPKTGTNWLYEILMMILKKSAEPVEGNKGDLMLEFQSAESVDKQPAPRIVNCHYPCRYLLLKDMKDKQIKTILCCRNPKDTAVSYYNHMKGIKSYEYDGKWSDWLPVYLQGKLEYGKYTDYLIGWEKEIQNGVGYPLHIMYYEDMKKNGSEEIEKLLKFLGVDLDNNLKNDILKQCGFDIMVKRDKVPPAFKEMFFKSDFSFLRKGQVGDWKNWFTVAQNEMFDDIWEKEMSGSSFSKFTYSMY
ncbi:sulfotransferase 1B1-like isoform X1 [Ruditapes philippinarum]|uniref:sulfotransferase 1B1-like isoform X1 n=1 Tax=Ruditapes philippinarum TaxID=129788 RepID=UPI00295BD212|nr:sulfotransferase 1B1-like isoform X1 [Ruditapes philippinarum]XP_060586562.1 sulfotransferase 1B1-like isoform X1 [Ruditapes philippinarum]XP_060586564.1 sulfotransferase 1B1-like isoform X1 [Ruditapes philippinarum]XP_060586567.1 sulfotransferase 1B1-like isoform X1 [Ruditapes philippinarum]XP_060586568.1 sulfotransferase 1B1-like isoform X1 [Ruditapes philippinarum]